MTINDALRRTGDNAMQTETKLDAILNVILAVMFLGAVFTFGAYMAYTSHVAYNVFGGVAVMAVSLLIGGSMLICIIPRRY